MPDFYISAVIRNAIKMYIRCIEVLCTVVSLEFKAVIVLPTITRNYGNYPCGNYVGNAPVGKVITFNT